MVSKVANFAVDLPDAAVAIQVSGSFGSRQEEAQRIGRIMRPKTGDNLAWFYTLVSSGTKEIHYRRNGSYFYWSKDTVIKLKKLLRTGKRLYEHRRNSDEAYRRG